MDGNLNASSDMTTQCLSTEAEIPLSHRDIAQTAELNALVTQVYNQWKGLIHKAACRYEVPGKYDYDDAVQEAVLIIWDLLGGGESKHAWDHTGDEFRKVFKTVLFHKLCDSNRYWRTSKRNYRKEISLNRRMNQTNEDADPDFFSTKTGYVTACNQSDDPAAPVMFDELCRKMERALPEYARVLWQNMVSPSPKLCQAMDEYLVSREINYRHRVPIIVYSIALDIPYKVCRNALREIRKTYCEVFGRDDLKHLAVA
jgi:hypothetical protein